MHVLSVMLVLIDAALLARQTMVTIKISQFGYGFGFGSKIIDAGMEVVMMRITMIYLCIIIQNSMLWHQKIILTSSSFRIFTISFLLKPTLKYACSMLSHQRNHDNLISLRYPVLAYLQCVGHECKIIVI